MVLGAEVGVRWLQETAHFLLHLAKGPSRAEAPEGERPVRVAPEVEEHACLQRRRAFALFLLDRRVGLGSDGATPTTSDVVGDCRHTRMWAPVLSDWHDFSSFRAEKSSSPNDYRESTGWSCLKREK